LKETNQVATKNLYEVLGVSRNATEDQIRSAYRQQALKYHPDRNRAPDAAERFKEVTEAYEVLRDREKRAMYDRFGHVGSDGPFGAAGFGGFGGLGFEDIFETFFGAGTTRNRRTRAQRGTDLRYDIELAFEDAVFGCEKDFEISRHETCATCSGSGLAEGTQPETCTRCGGSGELRRASQTMFGQFVNVTVCDRCHGEGRVITTPCGTCQGQGRVPTKKHLQVTVPAGIDDGTQMRLAGEGEPGAAGGTPGHLYINIHVKPHRYFRRQGNDLLLDVPVNVAQAALGDEIEIPTLDGASRIQIPAGTQNGRVVRLRSKGVPYLRASGRGDLQVKLHVAVPTELSSEQRRLFERLAETFGAEVKPRENKGFFEKVKDAFGV
jgi:molecular chaperone DnaJ